LLKSVPSTPEIEHISSSLEHSMGNYVQDTSRQPSTQQGQASIQLGQPTTQPGEQGIESADATSEPAQPLEPSQPASESSQPSSEFSQPTSQYSQPNSEAEPVVVIPKKGRQSNHYWFVDAIGKFNIVLMFSINKFQLMYLIFTDEDGVSKNLKVKVKDAHNLPNGLRVVVNYDDKYQPIGEASGLLAGVCGQLATNCILFPISFERWSSVPDTYKDKVWESLKVIKLSIVISSIKYKL